MKGKIAKGVPSSDKESSEGGSARLVTAIQAIRLRQKEIAERLEITAQYLSQVKTGLRPLSATVALKMETIFGISAKWLLEGERSMLADLEKAAQHIEYVLEPRLELGGRRPDMAFRDLSGKLHYVEFRGEHALPQAGRWGARRISVPLLDDLTSGRPKTSPHFGGAYVELPNLSSGEPYCVRAGRGYEPVFRDEEFLLIENRPSGRWSLGELDGKVCVARFGKKHRWSLCHLHVVAEGEDARVRLSPVSARARKGRTMRWNESAVAGVVLMAFRTRFQAPNSTGQ